MRTFVLLVILALAGLIYMAVVLRLPRARTMLTTLLRIGWIWVGVIIVLGAVEAYIRWA